MFRAPSVAWEPLPLWGNPAVMVWAWYFPPTAPATIQVQVPVESVAAAGATLTIRALAATLGIPVESLHGWDLFGTSYLVAAGALSLIDQPLPTVAGAPCTLTLRLGAWPVVPAPAIAPLAGHGVPATTAPLAVAPPAGANAERLLDAMLSDWLAIGVIERQMDGLRKQLGNTQGRLQSLNRDLSPDERNAADNSDRKDWQDARRWLRDAVAGVSRYIREYDIGSVSAAGGRHRFEELIRQYVEPRIPWDGITAAQAELEQYRRTHQSLHTQMQSALATAQRDGEQRAQQLLTRIAAKVRTARTKR